MGPRLAIATSNSSPCRLVLPLESLGLQPARYPDDHRLPTARALAVQRYRIITLNRIELFKEAGHPKCQAARLAGSKYHTVWRWQKLREAGGDDALLPQTNRCGRRSQFNVPDGTLSKVERLALMFGSRRKAWSRFSRSSDCPVEFARLIRPRKRHVPKFLLDQIPLRTINARLLFGPTQFCIVLPKGGAR